MAKELCERFKMSVEQNFQDALTALKSIKNYDIEGFSSQLLYWIKQLSFFYNTVVPQQTNDPSTSFYNVEPSKRPKEGQVAYFNLRRGYPKETYDGHYCYILKEFKMKYVIIPLTSVKPNSSPLNPQFEYDIQLINFPNNLLSRLQVTDIRSVDMQRLNEKRPIYNVLTDPTIILNNIKKFLF